MTDRFSPQLVKAGTSALAEQLIAAREASGLSLRGAAIQAGLAPSHLHALEHAKSLPTLPTLARLLELYPRLSSESLLSVARPPESAHPSTHSAFVEASQTFGMAAHRVSVGKRLVRIVGLQPTVADIADETVRLALMRAACIAPGSTRRELSAEQTGLSEQHHRHRFEWAANGLTYERSGPSETAWDCLFPAQELVLQAGRGSSASISVRSQTGGQDIGDELHPCRPAGNRTTLVVSYPVVGVRYEVQQGAGCWQEAPGEVMRRYRKAAGLTLEQVAAIGGFSLNAASSIEIGTQMPGALTLMGYLKALPELPLRRLLPGRIEGGEAGAPSAFEQAAAVAGLVCDEIVKEVTVAEDGTRVMRVTTLGLKCLRGELRDREILLPYLLGSASPPPGVPEEIQAHLEAPTARGRRRFGLPDGQVSLEWKDRRAVLGVDFVRSHDSQPMYAMTPARAAEVYVGSPPYREGASALIPFPAKRARVIVNLPPGLNFRGPRGALWASALFPDLDLPQWSARPVAPISVRERSGGGVRLSFFQRDALPGTKLAVGWELAD